MMELVSNRITALKVQNYKNRPTETTSLEVFFFKNSDQQLRDQFYLILLTSLLKMLHLFLKRFVIEAL